MTDVANPYRLPRTAIPERYQIKLEPDLESATFLGHEVVRIHLGEPTDEIVLNAAELDITEATIANDAGAQEMATVAYDEDLERATLTFPTEIESGQWDLRLAFSGILNDRLRGFYRSTFTDVEGIEQTIATTQFESSDARRAFPCWDEPDLKAVFSIKLNVPADLFAVSNSTMVRRTSLGNGKDEVTFADTMKMSTYLVAMVVGPFEATEPVVVDGVPVRVIYPIGKGHLASYALEAGAYLLRYFTDYYGIAYPGDKVDFIAIPDFAFGAMENLGAITYRESLVLIDPDRASQQELRRVADVIAHELAHMWFGDLVTMKWWTGIWLNEAFASFMEMKAVDEYRPDWKRWLSFAVDPGADRFDALDIDALRTTRPVEFEVESPDEADAMFDALTYGKGSAVLRMLEQFIGEDAFRDGVRTYLKTHSYGNTVTADLWAGLETATDVPVGRIMDTWILQGGYPWVEVSDGKTPTVSQSRFTYLPLSDEHRSRWEVPLLVRSLENHELDRVMLGGPEQLRQPSPLANAGGHGFYRVGYPHAYLEQLADRIEDLSALEQFTLLDDVRAAMLAGRTEASTFLSLATRYTDNRETAMWQLLVTGAKELDHIVSAESDAVFARFIQSLALPLAEELGWTPAPDEDDLARSLRATVLWLLGRTGAHRATIEEARLAFDQMVTDPASVDPDVARTVVFVVADHGDDADYERYVDLYRNAATPQDENRFMLALPAFRSPDLAERTFEMTLNGDIRLQNGAFVVARMIDNKHINEQVWAMLKENWEQMVAEWPPMLTRHSLDFLQALSSREVAADVAEFFDGRHVPQGAKAVPQQLERVRVHADFRQRERERLPTWLASHER